MTEARPYAVVAIVDELTYRSYVWNRQQSPLVTLQQWRRVFERADVWEARYQQERAEQREAQAS